MTKAFEGVRIVDFTQVLCGPMATAQLALLGAEVIKIEQPEVGDQMRMLSARDHWAETRCSPAFMGVNYGKRSITLNLKAPEAKTIVTRLVTGANAIAENFKPGVLDRLGFASSPASYISRFQASARLARSAALAPMMARFKLCQG